MIEFLPQGAVMGINFDNFQGYLGTITNPENPHISPSTISSEPPKLVYPAPSKRVLYVALRFHEGAVQQELLK